MSGLRRLLDWIAMRLLGMTGSPIIANVAWEHMRAQSLNGSEIIFTNCYQTTMDPAKSPIVDAMDYS